MTSSARERMLDAAVVHFAEHGVEDRSLRAIAAGIGTSHRMVIYHFGSREGLLAEVVLDRHRRRELRARGGPPRGPRRPRPDPRRAADG